VKVLFSSIPAYGHLYPLMPLLLACADQGHDVVLATGEPFASRLEVPTVEVQSWSSLDEAEAEVRRRHPELAYVAGPEKWRFGLELFADVSAGRFAEAMLPILEERRPDLIVYEALNVGAAVAADIAGIPAVAHGISRWSFFPAAVHAAALERQVAAWASRERQPPEIDGVLGAGFLELAPPSLRDTSTPPPAVYLPIRPVPWSEPMGQLPGWLTEERGRPCVYLTLGTVVFGAIEALTTAIAGLSELDVDVLVTAGPRGEPEALGLLPPRVHVERFVPQHELLPLVDAVVHHGGTGTMLGALYHGLPQVLIPQGADQFSNAQMIQAAGAGRSLIGPQLTVSALAEAVSAVLGDGPERRATRGLRDEIEAMPLPAERVSLLEQLASA
jgi:UDP:flavonoid glycosyltransferase YjiC (YdhE family)